MSSNITDQSAAAQGNETIDKGKGKAVQPPAEETEAETSEDEEMGAVCSPTCPTFLPLPPPSLPHSN